MHPVSTYLLTFNSEKYLEIILERVAPVSDELLIVDSGSSDSTIEIAKRFGAQVYRRSLDDFVSQRRYALERCTHDLVLVLDSDEVPNAAFVDALASIKESETIADAYRVCMHFTVLGKRVHSFFTVPRNPAYLIRVFRKSQTSFAEGRLVHETPRAVGEVPTMEGEIDHHTFESREELERKLTLYGDLAAEQLRRSGRRSRWWQRLAYPPAAFFKWYVLKGGWRDGHVGLILGAYAARYTHRKYRAQTSLD